MVLCYGISNKLVQLIGEKSTFWTKTNIGLLGPVIRNYRGFTWWEISPCIRHGPQTMLCSLWREWQWKNQASPWSAMLLCISAFLAQAPLSEASLSESFIKSLQNATAVNTSLSGRRSFLYSQYFLMPRLSLTLLQASVEHNMAAAFHLEITRQQENSPCCTDAPDPYLVLICGEK